MKITDILNPRAVSYYETVNSMLHDMQTCIKNGEILNPEFQEWKGYVSRLCDAVEQELRDKWVNAGKYEKLPEDIKYFDLGSGAVGTKGWAKKVAAIKGPTANHPMLKDIMDAYTQLMPYISITEQLKPLVVKVTAKRAQIKQEKEVEFKKTFTDASSLTSVLMKNIDMFVEEAGKQADAMFDRWLNVLDTAEWNIDAAAPAPSGRTDNREQYLRKKDRRDFLMSLTIEDESKKDPTNRWGSNPWRKPREDARERHVTMAKDGAKMDYLAWVRKMISKIGKPVAKATMSGNPWENSRIEVTCDDGENQVWRTQMIINRSRYNRLFNQFPSRRQS